MAHWDQMKILNVQKVIRWLRLNPLRTRHISVGAKVMKLCRNSTSKKSKSRTFFVEPNLLIVLVANWKTNDRVKKRQAQLKVIWNYFSWNERNQFLWVNCSNWSRNRSHRWPKTTSLMQPAFQVVKCLETIHIKYESQIVYFFLQFSQLFLFFFAILNR